MTKLSFSFIFLFFISSSVWAADTTEVSISLPNDFTSKICPYPAWKDKSAVWKDVQDQRPTPAVGTQQQKKNQITEVFANPPLASVFDKALTQLLPACGLNLIQAKPNDFPGPMELSLEITEFDVGTQKKFLTGKSEAKSRLTLIGKHAGQTTLVVEIGYGIDSKKLRQKDLKQLQATLNDLLFHTLEQIPLSRQLQDGLI